MPISETAKGDGWAKVHEIYLKHYGNPEAKRARKGLCSVCGLQMDYWSKEKAWHCRKCKVVKRREGSRWVVIKGDV